MRRVPIILITVSGVVVSLFTAVALAVFFRWISSDWPYSFHGRFIGICAVVFGLSDFFFTKLLAGLNSALRQTAYSVLRREEIEAVVTPLRRRMWRLWGVGVALKVAALLGGVVLQADNLSRLKVMVALSIGYGAICVGFVLGARVISIFQRTERYLDKLSAAIVAAKEKRRLKAQLNDGPEHDFESDEFLKQYSKPPEPLGGR